MPEEKTKNQEPAQDENEERNENEENEKEDNEEESRQQEEFGMKSIASLTSPEALVAFLIAGIIDSLGFFILWFGLDDFFILDTIAFLTLGMWMSFRTGHIPDARMKSKSQKAGKKLLKKLGGKKLLKRLGFASLSEIIPYFGGLMPSWILMVYFELKNNPL